MNKSDTPMTLSEARIGLLFHEKRIAELVRALTAKTAECEALRGDAERLDFWKPTRHA